MPQVRAFSLEKYRSGGRNRYRCPSCDKPKTFTRYVDESSHYLADDVGRCDREIECGYHKTPKQFFAEHPERRTPHPAPRQTRRVPEPETAFSVIAESMVKTSLSQHNGNRLADFLSGLLSRESVNEVFARYRVGTDNQTWPGATVFWQTDGDGQTRTGKVMLYDGTTGKRVKEPHNCIDWVHARLRRQGTVTAFELGQCLFGEHLLKADGRPVAMVESEKTAVIGALCVPAFLWLACGGLSNLSVARCQGLRGRNVMLLPDLGALAKWESKAQELAALCQVTVADFLEREASAADLAQGFDVADYLLREKTKPSPVPQVTEREKSAKTEASVETSASQPERWSVVRACPVCGAAGARAAYGYERLEADPDTGIRYAQPLRGVREETSCKGCGAETTAHDFDEETLCAVEERAAVYEYDGGLSRPEAEQRAVADTMHPRFM